MPAEWYDRGAKTFQATKFRKGACDKCVSRRPSLAPLSPRLSRASPSHRTSREHPHAASCGAMTHAAKDCVERPRAKGARLTGKAIAADEKVQSVSLDYEGKHDRYNGYDPEDYARVVARFEKVEALKAERSKAKELAKVVRREARARAREEAAAAGAPLSAAAAGDLSSDSEGEQEAAAAAAAAAAGGEGGGEEERLGERDAAEFGQVTRRVRTAGGGASASVRNLRIREDTAKYLLNLDVASAHYDPKTRSMREDPTPHAPPGSKTFAGDNAHRSSGDAARLAQLHVHAWVAGARDGPAHVAAAPSAAEAAFRAFKAKREAMAGAGKASVLERYGNAAAGDPPPMGLLLGQSESYAEYDASGRLVKGTEAAQPKSRWEEDVFLRNHTAVWGSFWANGAWGFACCHSTVKSSYCTGAGGIAAEEEAGARMAANVASRAQRDAAADAAAAAAAAAGAAAGAASGMQAPGRADKWGSDARDAAAPPLDPTKLAAALAAEDARAAAFAAAGGARGAAAAAEERRRGYNSVRDGDAHGATVGDEEMEAFRLKRVREEDPTSGGGGGTAGYDLV